MEREWLEKFYTECGREVSLAYNVLNHSNNWGVTLATAFLATTFVSSIEISGGKPILYYPTIIHWFLIIGAWIALVRFFVRSALGLVNMYRWNELIHASSKVLSLPEGNPALPIYVRNCAKKIDSYYYRFRSPVKRKKIIWQNLKLMYLWFFLIVLALFAWGLLVLKRDWLYYLGIASFIFPTIIESIWFTRWYGLKYEKLDLEKEPDIVQLWRGKETGAKINESKTLVFGFCEEGPYKHAISLLQNPTVKWIPWNYHAGSIDPAIINDLSEKSFSPGQKVAFASWPADFRGKKSILRFGRIDHFISSGGYLITTVFLEECDKSAEVFEIEVNNPKLLCFYFPK